MEWKRYRLIVRRWFWLLALAVLLSVAASWIYIRQLGHGNTLLVVLFVALGGLIWGLLGIFGVEYLTDNVLVVEDLRRITGKRVLADVPARRRGAHPLFEAPGSTCGTAYQMAGLKLLPGGNVALGRTVLVCSSQASPYVAHASANLAAVYSHLGHPTLLIDADRLDPELSKALNAYGQPGFAEAISSRSSDVVLHVVPSVPNLYMLPAGAAQLAQQMTFSMPYLRSIIERAGAQGSMIVIAGPPVSTSGVMALGLAKSAHDVVLTVVAGETKRRGLHRAVDTLEQAGAHLAGIVYVESPPSSWVVTLQRALSGSGRQTAQVAPQRAVNGHARPSPSQLPASFTPANAISADNYAMRQQGSRSGQPVRRIEVTASDITDGPGSHAARNRPAAAVPRPFTPEPGRPAYDPGPSLSMADLNATADAASLSRGLISEHPDLAGLGSIGGPGNGPGAQAPTDALDKSGLDSLSGQLADVAPTGPGKPPQRVSPLRTGDRSVHIPVPGSQAAPDLGSLDDLLDFSDAQLGVDDTAPHATIHAPEPPPVPPSGREKTPPGAPLVDKLPESSMQSLVPRGERALSTMPEPYEEPAPVASFLSVLGGLVSVISKWITAQRLAAELRRAAHPARKRRVEASESGLSTRLKLAGAYIVGLIAPRSRADQRTPRRTASAPGQSTTPPVQAQAASAGVAVSPLSPRDAELMEIWLQEAMKARRMGDYRQAKFLVNKVLDRDPRNEAAWNLRLLLADTAPATSAAPGMVGSRPMSPVPMMRSRRTVSAPWGLAVLVAIAVLGGLVYLEWPQLSKIALLPVSTPASGSTGTGEPTQAPSAQVSPTAGADAGYEVKGEFLTFWGAHGGARILGEPISPRIQEAGDNGAVLQVQYFERARLELHPEISDKANQVTLGRLGVEVPVSGTLANPLPQGLRGDEVRFKETGFDVPQKFYDFWNANNGLTVFGYPLTPVLMDSTSGQPLAVQYFERARFEYHPEKAGTPDEVQLTDLGTQVYAARHPGK